MVKPPVDDGAAAGAAASPDPAALAALLDEHAPLGPVPLVPEVQVFQGRVLLELWGAAERLAGRTLPPPFWGYPWPGGISLARTVLDRPELVAGARVLDLGTGGGVSALAAVVAGAREVVANDQDPWAIATALLAAERQGLALTPLLADLAGGGVELAGAGAPTREAVEVKPTGIRSGGGGPAEVVAGAATGSPTASPELAADQGRLAELGPVDVILCGDLSYERRVAPRIRALLERARVGGAVVLAADAGRAYFDATGFTLLAEYLVPVPRDLEGATERTARVYLLE